MRAVLPALTICFVSVAIVAARDLERASPRKVGLDVQRLARLDETVERHVAEGRLPGAVLIIARHGRTAHARAYGSPELGGTEPMQTDALFRIASLTKPLVTTGAMLLYEQGAFLLDQLVRDFLPEFTGVQVVSEETGDLVAPERQLTIRHLLNHTSGITYGRGPHGRMYREARITQGLGPVDETVGEMVLRLARIPLVFHPGDEFVYGLSMDVVGRLIEVITGQSLADYMRQAVLDPLRMTDTGFRVPRAELHRVAPNHVWKRDRGLVREEVDLSYLVDHGYYSGGGGMVSTAADYARFAQMILNQGVLDGRRLLSRKTVELMTTNSIGDLYSDFRAGSGDKFGYGFGIRTERGQHDGLESVGTLGWDGAHYCRFWIDPAEDMVVVFLAQSLGSWRLGKVIDLVRVLTYQAIDD